jgi:hypothetical protein
MRFRTSWAVGCQSHRFLPLVADMWHSAFQRRAPRLFIIALIQIINSGSVRVFERLRKAGYF